jgi:lysophospholipase L1-like esterase
MEEIKMTQENIKQMMQKPETQKVISTVLQGMLRDSKKEKVKNYKIRNQYAIKGQILFVGSSLMEFFPINEMQQTLEERQIIYNRGIGGYQTSDLLASMEECIFELEPSKIFINIGTNDIGSAGYKKEKLIANYDEILNQIHERLPECKVYVMAYYPMNEKAESPNVMLVNDKSTQNTRTNMAIQEANVAVEELAKKYDFEFINVNVGLMDEDGNLIEKYTIDGIHMWPNAYSIILENMKKYL